MFVKKGDKVRVIAGKDKGTEAVVLKALPKVNKVVVEGVAIIKKHQKPSAENPQGATKLLTAKKFVTTKNQAKCLTNHEGKEKVLNG